MIGAQTGGLTGVDNDVEAMAKALAQRGFDSVRCQREDATRAGILDAYERLIADTGSDDAVVVYYSGHGGFIRPSALDVTGLPPLDMQFIVPTDYDRSTEVDFRGITSIELSLLLQRLTQKSTNVVVVLDCCHAGYMSRDLDLLVKALHLSDYGLVAAHLERLHRSGALDGWDPQGSPDAVRIVACAREQSAFECTIDGVRNGALTEALTSALTEAGELPVTWSTLIERVRRRVLTLISGQRPEAEGPSRRLLFDTRRADPVGTLPVVAEAGGRVRLSGGPLFGVQVGDEFIIMPADAPDPAEATSIGRVSIDRLEPTAALGRLQLREGCAGLPLGARAHCTKAVAPALPVRVPHPDPRTTDVVAAVAKNTIVRVAGPDEPCSVEVRVDDEGGLTVHDRIGPLHPARHPGPDGVHHVVKDLERLARAHALRGLAAPPEWVLDTPVTIEWGLVDGGERRPLPHSGAAVPVGQPIYVAIRNEGSHIVHASLLDVGVAARVSVLTTFAPAGVRLEPGEEYVFGQNELERMLVGEPLFWPPGLDPAQARPETVVVLVTSAPQDVSVLEQDGVGEARDRSVMRSVGRSPLEQVLAQIATGQTRDLLSPAAPPVRYRVGAINFDLDPENVPFHLDERPQPFTPRGLRAITVPTATGTSPKTVAVRLSELVVHRNKALRSADIRVDAVVLTGGAAGGPVYRAQTARFSNIRDDERLPLDQMLVYHGPAVDYLDLAVWVSRDTVGSLALSDLLRNELTSPSAQAALAQLGSLMTSAPQAAAAAAAVGASAVIINVAYKVLLGAVGDSIGLYRTTALSREGFGVGRHPPTDLMRAQDFSFAYTVEDIH